VLNIIVALLVAAALLLWVADRPYVAGACLVVALLVALPKLWRRRRRP
jgi:hypothetical protein